jgi:DNA invertase Pin-like site-specific DNA recombinase
MLRAGLYARVSTNDQQTLPMQLRAMREYAVRRGWPHAAARSIWYWCGDWTAGAVR